MKFFSDKEAADLVAVADKILGERKMNTWKDDLIASQCEHILYLKMELDAKESARSHAVDAAGKLRQDVEELRAENAHLRGQVAKK